MVYDHNRNPSKYSVALVSEGANLKSHEGMSFESEETDMFGHRKLGGIGDKVAAALKEYSPKYNKGRRIDVVNQRLGYLVRSGDPDALDSIVPMAFGNLALDLVVKQQYGRLVSIHKGFYDTVPLSSVTWSAVDVVDAIEPPSPIGNVAFVYVMTTFGLSNESWWTLRTGSPTASAAV